MKTLKTVLFSMLLSTFLFSCSKDDDNNNNNNTGNGTMTAKVDGANFNANLAVQALITSGVCSFAGTGGDGQINVAIPSYTGPGTYAIGGTSFATATYALTASPFTAYSASAVIGSGTITITSDTGGYLEGTFSFSAVNNTGGTLVTKNITDGSFRIKLTI